MVVDMLASIRVHPLLIVRTLVIVLATAVIATACAGPIGIAYTATSAGTAVATGKTIPEHTASKLTDSDCSIWDAVVNLAYICEYNKNPAVTYNRNPF